MNECTNCNKPFEGGYCNHCGQKLYTDQDKSVKHLLREVVHFLTYFDGTFIKTLKTIILQPGQLSLDYSKGIRKKYYKPVSLFILIVILYLVFPVFKGLNIGMEYYTATPLTGSYITKQIEEKVFNDNISVEDMSDKFKQSSEKISKILLILFVLFSALTINILFKKIKRYAYDNLILALEINIFYLLIFFIVFPILFLLFYKISHFTIGPDADYAITFIISLCLAIYSSIAFRKIFKDPWNICFGKGVIFAVLHMLFLMLIYRPIVFEVTFSLI